MVCPFRVVLIVLSAAIAIFATMAAMAKDPTDEEIEEERRRKEELSKRTAWASFVDFWTGRYLYRETKRLFPFFFRKEENVECDFSSLQCGLMNEKNGDESTPQSDNNENSACNEFQQSILNEQHQHVGAKPIASAPSEDMPSPSAPLAESFHENSHTAGRDALQELSS